MSMDLQLWEQWQGVDPDMRPVILPRKNKVRVNRNGVPQLVRSFSLESDVDIEPQAVARTALRLVCQGKGYLVPEPLRSAVAAYVRVKGCPPSLSQALGAIDAGGMMAGGAIVPKGSSLFSQLGTSSNILQAAAKVIQEKPAIAEKMAAQAELGPPPEGQPGDVIAPDEKTAQPYDTPETAYVEPLTQNRTGLVYNTRTGLSPEQEALIEQSKGKISASEARSDPTQEAIERQAGETLRQAAQAGVLTAEQVHNVKLGLQNAKLQGQAITPELLTQEVVKQQIAQGVNQATGGGPAQSTIGSLFGVGLGGPALGTGPLGGAIGQALQSIFGTNQLPAGFVPTQGGLAATGWLQSPQWLRAAGLVDGVGTAFTGSMLGIGPEIAGIRRGIESQFLDYQARRNARWEEETKAFRREVLRLLWAIYQQHIDAGYGGGLQERRY